MRRGDSHPFATPYIIAFRPFDSDGPRWRRFFSYQIAEAMRYADETGAALVRGSCLLRKARAKKVRRAA